MPQIEPRKDSAAQSLQDDERWLLVQRILSTEGFQRAGQLRKILSHITQAAILAPEVPLREYDIACDVLERRADFDPAHDNIVRSQFSHLRRKLDQYYANDGKLESLQIEIPKGSYLPVFSPRLSASPGSTATATGGGAAPPAGQNRAQSRWRTWHVVTLIILTCAVTLLAVNAWRVHQRHHPSNAFLAFLARSPGQVSIVLPDTSQMMLQLATKDNITASEYASRDYPQRQLAEIKNPALRQFLGELLRRRNTSVGEAAIAVDFIRAFGRLGIPASLRYARDLHVSDFGEGNIILIGSRKSNPWVSLFTEKMNFQFIQDPSDRSYYFANTHPAPGEQARYERTPHSSGETVSYVDVALTPNVSRNGYILLIDGGDVEANEAAARYLLNGPLGARVSELLTRKNNDYFEIFLRGRHISGQADDSFEVVAVRPLVPTAGIPSKSISGSPSR